MSRTLFDPPDTPPPRQVLSVSELNLQLRSALQERFPSVWVCGEVSDLSRPGSGHIYLTLKDDQGQLKAVVWRNVATRLEFEIKDGMELICEGYVDLYPPRGTYQLILRQIEPKGIGALQLALLQLRERLGAEGLFDPRRKRPLPRFPRQIALITSPTGAAIRDFLEVQRRRWQGTQVLVIPTRVQGAEASGEIVAALEVAQRLQPRPEILVVTRGGGSLEDLWCFNDERVVRAIARSTIPVVSAIGHEIDVTLADLAADVRALTPSEAAERVSPSETDIRAELDGWQRLLGSALERKLQLARARLDALAARPVLLRPTQRLHDLQRQIDDWQQRLERTMLTHLQDVRQRLAGVAGQLEALSPLAVLSRGYSLTHRVADGALVRAAEQVAPDDEIVTRLGQGEIRSRVLTCQQEP